MSIPAAKFEDAWVRREVVSIDELAIPFISLPDLLASKRAGDRPQDEIDAANLEKSAFRPKK
jgi:hypothetical protein